MFCCFVIVVVDVFLVDHHPLSFFEYWVLCVLLAS